MARCVPRLSFDVASPLGGEKRGCRNTDMTSLLFYLSPGPTNCLWPFLPRKIQPLFSQNTFGTPYLCFQWLPNFSSQIYFLLCLLFVYNTLCLSPKNVLTPQFVSLSVHVFLIPPVRLSLLPGFLVHQVCWCILPLCSAKTMFSLFHHVLNPNR